MSIASETSKVFLGLGMQWTDALRKGQAPTLASRLCVNGLKRIDGRSPLVHPRYWCSARTQPRISAIALVTSTQ